MQPLKRLTDLLLAQRLFLHNIHLLARSNSDHKLAEELEDDLMAEIDILKEIALYVYSNESIAYAYETAQGTADILKELPPQPLKIEQLFSFSLEIFTEIIRVCSDIEKQETEAWNSFGLRNAVQDVAEKASQKGYRIKRRLLLKD